jgi:hypothetical protein
MFTSSGRYLSQSGSSSLSAPPAQDIERELAKKFCHRRGTLYIEQVPSTVAQDDDGAMIVNAGPTFSVRILEAEVLKLLHEYREMIQPGPRVASQWGVTE